VADVARIDRGGVDADTPFAVITTAFIGDGPDWVDMEAAERDSEQLRRAFEEEFESTVSARYSDINIGRGGDAPAVIVELVVTAWVALVASGKLMKMTREAADEWVRLARTLGVPGKVRRLMDRLTRDHIHLHAVTVEMAALYVIDLVETRTGNTASLVWWEDMAVDPMEWVAAVEGLPATPQRIYTFIVESAGNRYYVVTKADGTVIVDTGHWIPAAWMDYELWRRT
jgi:hypothetical protein